MTSCYLKYLLEKLVRKLKVSLGFYYRNKACFNFGAEKTLVLSEVLDYGDAVHMHSAASTLQCLDWCITVLCSS